MANDKGNQSTHTRKVIEFPEFNGKTIERVELHADHEYYAITIHFPDKTALCFTVEPCVVVFPAHTDWKTDDGKILKRWEPVHSIIKA